MSVQAEGAKAAAEVLVEDPTATAAALAGFSAASEACQPRGVFVFGLAATTTTAPSATGPSVFVQAGGAKTAAEELVVDPSATAASVEGHSTAMEVCQPLAAATAIAPAATGVSEYVLTELARHSELARLSRLERLNRPVSAATTVSVEGQSAAMVVCRPMAATAATAPSMAGPTLNQQAEMARHAVLARLARLERLTRSRNEDITMDAPSTSGGGATEGTYEAAFPLLSTRQP